MNKVKIRNLKRDEQTNSDGEGLTMQFTLRECSYSAAYHRIRRYHGGE